MSSARSPRERRNFHPASVPFVTNLHYKNGANFERRCKTRLEEAGWTVWRTAGSHSKADLIAVRLVYQDAWPEIRLYQCKSGVTPMTKKAKQEFYSFAAGLGAEAWLAERGMKFTKLESQTKPEEEVSHD